MRRQSCIQPCIRKIIIRAYMDFVTIVRRRIPFAGRETYWKVLSSFGYRDI